MFSISLLILGRLLYNTFPNSGFATGSGGLLHCYSIPFEIVSFFTHLKFKSILCHFRMSSNYLELGTTKSVKGPLKSASSHWKKPLCKEKWYKDEAFCKWVVHTALCVRMHRQQKSWIFSLGLSFKNLGVFRMGETHIWCF